MTIETLQRNPEQVEQEARLTEAALAFWGMEPTIVQTLSDGLVNQTYRVGMPLGKTIMQRLSPVINSDTMVNSVVVMHHMKSRGWEVPTPLTTQAGTYAHTDIDGYLWRAMTFVESDAQIPGTLNEPTLRQIGCVLGGWHRNLAESPYKPVSTLPHFHDTAHHATKLQNRLAALPDEETKQTAQAVLTALADLPVLPATGSQLIHGDPKLANMLFRDGQPFTLIDYDTHMTGTIWMDIGDLLRSVCSYDLEAGRPVSVERLVAVLDGYKESSGIHLESAVLTASALNATRLIGLELAARYLNDIVDQNYFSWDASKGLSRRDYLFNRALTQWQIVNAFNKEA